jgi:hypothetical protein
MLLENPFLSSDMLFVDNNAILRRHNAAKTLTIMFA